MEDGGVDISVQLRHVCLEYPVSTLQAATRDFDKSMRLGEGSAGTVFKAEMQDGSFAAVKVIDLASLGDMQAVAGFEEEVMILSKFRHPNVVVLMGWAREGARRFLIYEYLPGGDVCGRLNKCKDGRSPFLWYERLAVARDSAMGLAHLHNATPHAFHRDVKSSNILLGASGAKIADFGLSVVGKTRTCAAFDCEFPSGTPGYTCPNYITSGKMTEGSEVYSFGMVLLEMLMNMLPAGMLGEDYVYPIQDKIMPIVPGAIDRAVSSADSAAGWPAPVAREVAALGLACIDGDESRRPCFNDICRLLRFLQEQYPPTCCMGPEAQMQVAPPPTGHAMPPPGHIGLPMHTALPGVMAGPGAPPGVLVRHAPLAAGIAMAPPPLLTGVLGPGLLPAPGAPAAMRVTQGAVMPGLALGPGRPVAAPGYPLQGPGRAVGPTPVCLPGPPQIATGVPGGPQLVRVHHAGVQVAPSANAPAAVATAAPGVTPPPVPVEVMLEVAHVHGAELAHMRHEFRMLPLLPAVDAEDRRRAVLGRQYQPHWFEKVLLDQSDLTCISREAFELSWGGPDPSQAALQLRVLGSNILLVDDAVVRQGCQVPLRPGSRITFAFEANPGALYIILAFLVHCAAELAMPPVMLRPGPPGAQQGAPNVVLQNAEAGLPMWDAHQVAMAQQAEAQAAALKEHLWELFCIFAAGLAPEAFWALPSSVRTLRLPLFPDSPPQVLGRTSQAEMFETLLAHDAGLLQCISRKHVQLEVASDEPTSIASVPMELQPALLVTNLSQNLIVASRVTLQPPVVALKQGEATQLHDGDTLSFATEQRGGPSSHEASDASEISAVTTTLHLGGDGSVEVGEPAEDHVSVVPFLTMRVIAPPMPPPPSPFVMMNPMSLTVAPAPPDASMAGREEPDLLAPEEGIALQPARLSAPARMSGIPDVTPQPRRSAPGKLLSKEGDATQVGSIDPTAEMLSSPAVTVSCGKMPSLKSKTPGSGSQNRQSSQKRLDECIVQ